MEFDRQADGRLNPLPAPSIDTGMGLERITAVIQGKLSNYDTDLFTPVLTAIGERAGIRYRASLADPSDVSMRVVADHLRAMTFLIADGVVPSNEDRGYILRRIMRRAIQQGRSIGLEPPFLGGADAQPNPVEVLLAALVLLAISSIGCLALVGKSRWQRSKIEKLQQELQEVVSQRSTPAQLGTSPAPSKAVRMG